MRAYSGACWAHEFTLVICKIVHLFLADIRNKYLLDLSCNTYVYLSFMKIVSF